MWLCELEKIQGAYFEFGVYNGTSLFAAMKCHLNLKSNKKTKFYGFDSFDDGFKYFVEEDKHNFFKEGDFVSFTEYTNLDEGRFYVRLGGFLEFLKTQKLIYNNGVALIDVDTEEEKNSFFSGVGW